MKKQIKNETESYYLKFLSDKYCSFKDDSVPLKFNTAEKSNVDIFSKDNVYKNTGTSNDKK